SNQGVLMKPLTPDLTVLRNKMRMLLPMAVFIALLAEAVSASSATVTRVVVWKKINTASPANSLFLPVSTSRTASAGFSTLADYAARTIFRGPNSAAGQLIADLKADGYDASLASDLDSFSYHGYRIDA